MCYLQNGMQFKIIHISNTEKGDFIYSDNMSVYIVTPLAVRVIHCGITEVTCEGAVCKHQDINYEKQTENNILRLLHVEQTIPMRTSSWSNENNWH